MSDRRDSVSQRNVSSLARRRADGGDDERLIETAMAWHARLRDGDVDEVQRRAFEQWLQASPQHRSAFAEVQALWQLMGELPDPRTVAARRSRWSPAWLSGVAVGMAMMALLLGWRIGAIDDLRADHHTHVGERRTVMLSDGSSLTLNTNSAVRIDFTDVCRCVHLLRGELYVEVQKNPQRPFEVHAGNGVARALGTAFGVSARSDGVTVSVTEGRVQVAADNDGGTAGNAIALAGDAVHYDRHGAIDHVGDSPEVATSWRDGKLLFGDRPLTDVVAELDRHRRGLIVLRAEVVASHRFSGVLDLDDTDRAVAMLASTTGLRVRQFTPLLTVLELPEDVSPR